MSDVNNCIAQLRKHSQLKTEEDALAFYKAMTLCSACMATSSALAIAELVLIFHDDVHHREVMDGLIHLVESAPKDVYIAGLLHALPTAERTAPEYMETLIIGIVNSVEHKDALLRLTSLASTDSKSSLRGILEKIAADRDETGERALDIIRRVTHEQR